MPLIDILAAKRDTPHSQSRAVDDLPTIVSISPTTIFIPESVPATVVAPPLTSTVVITSVLAQPSTHASATAVSTAVYTTITQVLTTIPIVASASASHETPLDTTSTTFTTNSHIIGAGNSKSGSPMRSSSARIGPSALPSSSSPHKAKSNIGKYVGYAIGGCKSRSLSISDRLAESDF
ncbi:hypothetical protein MIND_00055000 [Mycena indigotica]|uniref:Uncharacterized protein n=1 Tax=Mycena indigotica TaxID=2126181 RepID=A0A8H6TBD6_9AGAR|nr:uncharacterized protein MIND_00055000 [Mycena indigotica]KAF7315403.1 hypothetical protein MIND_00055000 [Mycena indigotica]